MPTTYFPTATLPVPYALMYPLTRTPVYKTTVQQFLGDFEVAFVDQNPVTNFTLTYTDIDADSVGTIQDFFDGQGGAGTSEFSIIIDSVQYDHLVFVDDVLAFNQSKKPNLWSITIKLRQTRAS